MRYKILKKIIALCAATVSIIAVLSFPGCSGIVIEFREGTWATEDVVLSDGTVMGDFSFTLTYVGGDIYDHYDEEYVYGYIYLDSEAYSLVFNIGGEVLPSVSSTYYRKELFGSGATWQGQNFNFVGKLKRKLFTGETYFDGAISITVRDTDIPRIKCSADLILHEVTDQK